MISLVYDVKKYRELLEKTVRKNQVVIEIGPHVGKSTERYFKKTKLTVVVDKAEQTKNSFEKLLRENENLKFVQGDVRGFETIKKVLKLTKTCDVLAVDMGGGRYPDTVFKVWATWSGVFKPKHSVIRNNGLAEFVQRAKIDDEKIMRKFGDDGWLSTWGRATPYKLKKQLDEFSHWVNINEKL